jgi:predicted nucleic acid-binding Zn ribbon protein
VSPRWEPLNQGRDRDPHRVGDSLDRVLPGGRTFRVLVERWSELVGDGLGARTRPSALHATTLVIAVDDPAWATQLKYLEGDLLTRFAEAVGAGAVTDLRVVVRPAGSA